MHHNKAAAVPIFKTIIIYFILFNKFLVKHFHVKNIFLQDLQNLLLYQSIIIDLYKISCENFLHDLFIQNLQ